MQLAAIRRFSHTALFSVYLLSFFYTLHVALPVYVNSTFLATLVPERFVGMLYAASSIFTILALLTIPRLLRVIGDYFATLAFIILEILALIGIAVSQSPAITVALFIASTTLIWLISFDLDLIIEGYSKNTDTGSVRGLYLTSANLAWVIAPVLSAMLLGTSEYWRVYIAAAAIFIPSLFIFALRLDHFRDPLYRKIHFRDSMWVVWQRKDLRNIFICAFLLPFFFTIMVIYTPLYLHEYIGFEWKELGVIFSVMLVPFLLLEAPLGRIADKYVGEKEFLVAGFIIMSVATVLLSFVTVKSFVLFALLLFMTRVGAAMVEIMTDTYFFKKVDGKDAEVVGLLRTQRHFAGFAAPLFAGVVLYYVPIQYIFIILGVVMLLGIPASLALRDTR